MASIEVRPGTGINTTAPSQNRADYNTGMKPESANPVAGGITSAIEALPDDLKAFARAVMNYPDMSPAAKSKPANPGAALERFVDAADKAVSLLSEAITVESEEMLRALDEIKDDDPELSEEGSLPPAGTRRALARAESQGERRALYSGETVVESEEMQRGLDETRKGGGKGSEEETLKQVKTGGASLQAEEPTVFSGGVSTVDTARILSRLMVELAGLQRQEALESRLASRELVKSELFAQADKLRDAAGEAKTAAIVQGVMTIAFSAVSIGTSVYAARGAAKTIGQMKQLNPTPDANLASKNALNRTSVKLADESEDLSGLQTARVVGSNKTAASDRDLPGNDGQVGRAARQEKKGELGAQSARYQGIAGVGTAVGGFGQSLGGLSASGLQEQAKLSEADAQVFAAEAEETRSEGDVFKEVQLALDEMIKAMINFLKELRAAEVEEMRAITKG